MLHIVDAAIDVALKDMCGESRLGLLATEATIASGISVTRALRSGSLAEWIVPSAAEMAELVMPGIAAVNTSLQVVDATDALARRTVQWSPLYDAARPFPQFPPRRRRIAALSSHVHTSLQY
jgi:aspartate/glutamate racemase